MPAHFDAEIGSALRRMVRQQQVELGTAKEAVRSSVRYPAERVSLAPQVVPAFALRNRFSAGDVWYALLARELGATLVTCDRGLASAGEGFIPVHYVRGG